MKQKIFGIVGLVLLLLVVSGLFQALKNRELLNLNTKKASSDTTEISIVATNFPAYDFARAVVGAENVTMLVPAGSDIHSYEPTVADIVKIASADLFIYTGGESDEWVENILNSVANVETLKMTDAVDLLEESSINLAIEEASLASVEKPVANSDSELSVSSDSEPQANSDPELLAVFDFDEHVWTSPKNAEKIVRAIAGKTSILRPEKSAEFNTNAENYLASLEQLDAEIRETVETAKKNTLIFGDRFPFLYFTTEYGLNYFAALPGCAEESEPDPATSASIIDYVKKNNAPAVLKLELSSGTIAETIASETGAKVLTLNSAHNISADDFVAGKSYIDIMQENLETLKQALN